MDGQDYNKRMRKLAATLASIGLIAGILYQQAMPALALVYYNQKTIDNSSNTVYGQPGMGTTGQPKTALLFYVSTGPVSICNIRPAIVTSYSTTAHQPSDQVRIRLYTDDGTISNPENGTLVDTINVAANHIVSSSNGTGLSPYAFPQFSFANDTGNICHSLQVPGWYWLVFSRTGSLCTLVGSCSEGYYKLLGYDDQAHRVWYYNGSSWLAANGTGGGGTGGTLIAAIASGSAYWIDNGAYSGGLPTSASYNFTTHDYGALGNFFRDIIVAGFWPSQNSLGQYASLSDTIKNKPPFGYFSAIKTAFSGLATSSGTADTTLAHSAIKAFTDPLRTGLAVVLWVGFGWYLWKRFIHFRP